MRWRPVSPPNRARLRCAPLRERSPDAALWEHQLDRIPKRLEPVALLYREPGVFADGIVVRSDAGTFWHWTGRGGVRPLDQRKTARALELMGQQNGDEA